MQEFPSQSSPILLLFSKVDKLYSGKSFRVSSLNFRESPQASLKEILQKQA